MFWRETPVYKIECVVSCTILFGWSDSDDMLVYRNVQAQRVQQQKKMNEWS